MNGGTAAATTIASIRGLSFWYPDADAPALRDVDLEVREGELLVLCGPSGGGKSTLLRLLQGIVPQRSGGDLLGQALALDRDVTRTPPAALAAAGVTLLYQDPLESFVADRVDDEVAFGPESLGLSRAEVAARVREALAAAGLAGLAARRLSALSGGEQQRVALAAALALRPRLLLLDEPTAHLDERAAVAILDLVDGLRRTHGTTVVLAEHRLAALAARADRLAIVVGGAVRAAGPPRLALADDALPGLGVPVPRAARVARRLGLPGPLPLTAPELAAAIVARGRPVGAGHAPPDSADRSSAVVARLDGVGHRYPGATAAALEGIDLEIRRGERIAIVGPSGAGKSTLARIAVGLRRPTSGHIEILGLADPPLSAVARRVGLVVQNPIRQLLGETVEGDIALGLGDLERDDARRRVAASLDRFGLGDLRRRHPLSLSEGQRRRVTLAATFARRPALLVLDEPTLAQDELQRAALASFVRELAADGTAVLSITHDREFVNDACERVIVLRAGRIAADLPLGGDPATIDRLALAEVPLADVVATVRELGRDGIVVGARTVDDLVKALA